MGARQDLVIYNSICIYTAEAKWIKHLGRAKSYYTLGRDLLVISLFLRRIIIFKKLDSTTVKQIPDSTINVL